MPITRKCLRHSQDVQVTGQEQDNKPYKGKKKFHNGTSAKIDTQCKNFE